MLCGFFSILVTLESMGEPLEKAGEMHRWAALLIMLAMILDGLDGYAARLLHAESAIGGELDTFVDLTAFGIAPAMLIYASATGFPPLLRIVLGCGLVASGAYRLARFKVIDPHHGQHGFTGLPITVAAALVSTAHIVSLQAPDSWGPLKLNVGQGPVATVFLAIIVGLTLLQVSRIHFPKPTNNPVFLAVSILLVILLFLGTPALAAGSALAMIAFGLYYILVSPFQKRTT
jgi:CDP-diacylglycerol--serine O-phosphatidyltransferase